MMPLQPTSSTFTTTRRLRGPTRRKLTRGCSTRTCTSLTPTPTQQPQRRQLQRYFRRRHQRRVTTATAGLKSTFRLSRRLTIRRTCVHRLTYKERRFMRGRRRATISVWVRVIIPRCPAATAATTSTTFSPMVASSDTATTFTVIRMATATPIRQESMTMSALMMASMVTGEIPNLTTAILITTTTASPHLLMAMAMTATRDGPRALRITGERHAHFLPLLLSLWFLGSSLSSSALRLPPPRTSAKPSGVRGRAENIASRVTL